MSSISDPWNGWEEVSFLSEVSAPGGTLMVGDAKVGEIYIGV
jgi:hypothetical protein